MRGKRDHRNDQRLLVVKEATASSSNSANSIMITSYFYTSLSKKPVERFTDIVM